MANEPSAEVGLKLPPNNRDSGAQKIWINGSAKVTKQKSKQIVTFHKSSPTVTLQAETLDSISRKSLTPTQSIELQLKEIDEASNAIDTKKFPVQNGNHAAPLLPELNTINIPPVANLPALPNQFGNLPSHLHSVSIPNLNPTNDNHVARDKHGSPRVSLPQHAPKWTRIDSQRKTIGDSSTQVFLGCGKRSITPTDNYSELLNKRQQVSRIKDYDISEVVEADIQPTNHNELPSVELSWAWEPTYREGAWGNSSGKRSIYRVYSQDIVKQNKARHSTTKY